MSLRVDDFKAKLKGGGARANLFRVILNYPAYAGGDSELTSFMCGASQLYLHQRYLQLMFLSVVVS